MFRVPSVEALKVINCPSQRHILRDRRRRTTASSLLGDGAKRIEIVYGEEKNILHKLTRVAKAERKSLVPTQAQGTNQEITPFICTL